MVLLQKLLMNFILWDTVSLKLHIGSGGQQTIKPEQTKGAGPLAGLFLLHSHASNSGSLGSVTCTMLDIPHNPLSTSSTDPHTPPTSSSSTQPVLLKGRSDPGVQTLNAVPRSKTLIKEQ
ncbi:unnamed protein product [Leuciscus chuanchicus]